MYDARLLPSQLCHLRCSLSPWESPTCTIRYSQSSPQCRNTNAQRWRGVEYSERRVECQRCEAHARNFECAIPDSVSSGASRVGHHECIAPRPPVISFASFQLHNNLCCIVSSHRPKCLLIGKAINLVRDCVRLLSRCGFYRVLNHPIGYSIVGLQQGQL